jgi:hypothetical protein
MDGCTAIRMYVQTRMRQHWLGDRLRMVVFELITKGPGMKPLHLLNILTRALAVIALGGFFLATYLKSDEFPIMTYWPVALVLVGVWGLVSSRESRVWGILFSVTGAGLYFYNQDVLTVQVVMVYWPTVLIAVGTFTLVRSLFAWFSWNKVIAAEIARTELAARPVTLFG